MSKDAALNELAVSGDWPIPKHETIRMLARWRTSRHVMTWESLCHFHGPHVHPVAPMWRTGHQSHTDVGITLAGFEPPWHLVGITIGDPNERLRESMWNETRTA